MKRKHNTLMISILALSLLTMSFAVTPTEAGTQDWIFTVHLYIDADSDLELKMGTSVKEEMAKVGVNVILEAIDGGTLGDIQYDETDSFLTYDDGGWDLAFTQWWWWPFDYVWFEGCWAASGEIPAGWNTNHWANGEADMYLQNGMSTYDISERQINLKKWQEVVMDDVPAVLIFWPVTFQLARAEVKGTNAVTWTHNIQQWTVEGKTAADDVTIQYAVLSDPQILNPVFLDGGWAHVETQYRPLFHKVVQPDGTFADEPAMAESYSSTPDGLTVTVNLRQGLTWHDGQPFTSKDVKLTLDAVIDPDTTASFYGDISALLGSTDIIDDYTVQLNLIAPAPHLINLLTSAHIVPWHVFKDIPHSEWRTHETNTVKPAVGTGPFKFVEWKQDQYMTLEAFEDYFEGPSIIDRLVLPVIPEATTALAALEIGDVDVLHPAYSDELVSDIPRILGLSDITAESFEAPAIQFLGFNLKHPILSNQYVRKAFASAMNYDHIIDDFMEGYAIQANSPVPPSWFAYNADVDPYHYDLTQAAAYLEQAGYKPPTTITATETKTATQTATTTVPELTFTRELVGFLMAGITIIALGEVKRKKGR